MLSVEATSFAIRAWCSNGSRHGGDCCFCFTDVSFVHVKQSLNEAAHLLAKSCEIILSSDVFHSVVDCIRRILCIDVI